MESERAVQDIDSSENTAATVENTSVGYLVNYYECFSPVNAVNNSRSPRLLSFLRSDRKSGLRNIEQSPSSI